MNLAKALIPASFAVVLGALIAFAPGYTALFMALMLWAVSSVTIPLRAWIALSIVGVLCIPWDFIGARASETRGLPTSAILLCGVPAILLRCARSERCRRFVAGQWDVVIFIAALCVAVALSGDFGGLREVLTWAGGFSLLLLVGLGFTEGELSPDDILMTLLAIGAWLGLGAILERLVGAAGTWAIVPGYQPIVREFSIELGNRASSWAGHPLRLGTASLVGVLSGWALLLGARSQRRILVATLVGLSGVGLVLSGARGSWLALAIGAIVLMLAAGPISRVRRMATAGLLVASGYFALSLAGFDAIIMQRIQGQAVDPTSVGQRARVLGIALDLWLARPLFGYGFRGIADAIYSRGLVLANYENEYLGILFAAGAVGFTSFLILVGRSLVDSLRRPRSERMAGAACLFVAMAVNTSTYNLFAWSAGPALFLLTVGLVRGLRFVESRSDS